MSYLSKLKLGKNQNCVKRSFSLSLLNIKWDLFDINAHNDQGCAGIETRSTILNNGNEAKHANHSATAAHPYPKQQEIYRQTI